MSSRPTAERIGGFGTSVFTEMSRLAVEHQAINLGQGFPDFAGPDFVKEAAAAAIAADMNQYAPSHGSPRLRRAIADDWTRRYGGEVDIDSEVTVTTGATEAIFVAMLAFLNPGDEIIFFEPFYDAYVADVAMAGATARVVRLHAPDWHFDPDELAAAFTDRTRLFLLNTPHNPTGKVFTRSELDQIAELCQHHDVTVLTDEVYDRIIFDANHHIPIATLPGMWGRTLTVNSTGKTFSMTGWKIGFTVGPADLNAAIRSVHQFSTFATATPFQEGMAVALETAERHGYYRQLHDEYAARRDRLSAVLADAGLPPLECQGAYFLLSDVTALGFDNDVDFCRYLVTEAGVAAIPPSAFYLDPATAPPLARFCFAKRFETIDAAADRLGKLRAGNAPRI
jgi:aspartate/methionine/tyrosine aminotransferase